MAIKQNTFWKGLFTLVSLLSAISLATAKSESNPPAAAYGKTLPRLAGFVVNLAGWDFGAQTNGVYSPGSTGVAPPKTQIPHFIKQNVNLLRVPVAWGFIQPEINKELNATNANIYREFIEDITSRGAYAIIDLHAYARNNGEIVGESPQMPASVLVNLWLKLGALFKDNKQVILGLSNEPHDQSIEKWAVTVQTLVTAMRKDGINNILLLPGTDWTSLKAFPDWYKSMKTVKNPDGSFDGLWFEAHRYLDGDNSGKSRECVASHADEVVSIAKMLKEDSRQILLGETGGGSTESCKKYLPELVEAVANAYPHFAGFAIWSAGAFDATYELVVTVKDESSPTGWKDQENWLSIKKFLPTHPPTAHKKAADKGAKEQEKNKGSKHGRRSIVSN
ncbi:hypothetical protein PtA15_18A275 [Puccinia triticina]|uniref:cellulase n=1 Tax=Puccinia triticina TaxID=208348 RepID=A0ABY7D954_9BASI|nr:uncharacterized protein PtA15_18A275 [Puccinia triticina]WAQ93217.1 hypothetical protein PtA15_18A275 [Puccinia triticina]